MKKAYKICWVMAVVLSQACHDVEKTPPKRFDKDPGFVTDIPIRKKGRMAGEPDAKMLGLDSLEYGYDSLQIRVWLGHSLAITNHIVIISSTNQKWHAQLITSYVDRQQKPAKIDNRSQSVVPKSGWRDFEKSLNGFNIVNLPHGNYDSTCDHCGGADGISYSFEIATSSTYRFFNYCNPDYAHGCPEAATVLQFAAFLEKEFDFTYTK